jgi:AmmeMemoRadiSam system protein B/AmmeMemoRadiSam system protein A
MLVSRLDCRHPVNSNLARPAAVAGRFYPADAVELADAVDAFVRAAGPPANGATGRPPKLLLAPHAGYVYSGTVAASAYAPLAQWAGVIRRVVLLGPTHRVALRGLAAPSSAAFDTPLGRIAVDKQALEAIDAWPQVTVNDAVHAQEHALEVQLPFLQRTLAGAFTLVPLVVGHASPEAVAQVLERLWGGDETLIVISSDLSHYLPYDEARARDRATIERVLNLDPRLDHDRACGATPLAGALIAARRHGLRPRLADLRNSGDTAGDRSRVVGYASVVFEAPLAAGTSIGDPNEALGQALVEQARHAIAQRLGLEARAAPAPHEALAAPGATFVTLRRHGELRGCVGTLEARRALRDDVRLHATAAAFEDPRFAPLSTDEFEGLEIEVSLIDRAEPLAAASASEAQALLRPHVDGVLLEWRGARATFLPQVWEQLCDPAAFLRALRRKAGLPADFWAEDLRLSRYRVRKFVAATA